MSSRNRSICVLTKRHCGMAMRRLVMTPDIVRAVHDPKLFRPYVTGADDGSLESWERWLTFLKVLYGLRTDEAEHETVRQCTGRDPTRLSPDGYTECLLMCGRRSGKSK